MNALEIYVRAIPHLRATQFWTATRGQCDIAHSVYLAWNDLDAARFPADIVHEALEQSAQVIRNAVVRNLTTDGETP